MKKTVLIFAASLFVWTINAQISNPVKWSTKVNHISGSVYSISFIAEIEDGWHMYGRNIESGGPIPTSFSFDESSDFTLKDSMKDLSKPHSSYDDAFQMNVETFDKEAKFTQLVNVLKFPAKISATVEFQCCNDQTCLPPKDEELIISIKAPEGNITANKQEMGEKELVAASGNNTNTMDSVNESGIQSEIISLEAQNADAESSTNSPAEKKSLWSILLLAMGGGLLGLLTPCVYPMIPMTISFFMSGKKSRGKSIFNGLFFGFSIMAIYTLIGLLVAITKSDFTGALNTHWIPNLIFFGLFFTFTLSFFGLFEIVLPSGIANKVDQQADKGGLLGPFFMALTTVIVSFSCTGPIVGFLLVEAVQGAVVEPVIGMFGFGFVFALPFTLFAIFPGMVKGLPKSGGWLNVVKVVLAFVILAFSLKFIANIDQAYHLNILSREIFVAIWTVLSVLLGLYLLGYLKFAHDSELKHLSIPRLFLAIITFVFALYLLPGIFGAPLKALSAFLPPASEQSAWNMNKANNNQTQSQNNLCFEPKYGDLLHLPLGLQGYFDMDEAIKCSKEQNKPIFVDFKGHFCSNCKKMEGEIWSQSDVLNKLKNEFIIVALYTDDKTKLPESEWIENGFDGKSKKTLGKKNENFQVVNFNTNTVPYYVILDTDGKPVNNLSFGYDPDKQKFIDFLNQGIADFKN